MPVTLIVFYMSSSHVTSHLANLNRAIRVVRYFKSDLSQAAMWCYDWARVWIQVSWVLVGYTIYHTTLALKSQPQSELHLPAEPLVLLLPSFLLSHIVVLLPCSHHREKRSWEGRKTVPALWCASAVYTNEFRFLCIRIPPSFLFIQLSPLHLHCKQMLPCVLFRHCSFCTSYNVLGTHSLPSWNEPQEMQRSLSKYSFLWKYLLNVWARITKHQTTWAEQQRPNTYLLPSVLKGIWMYLCTCNSIWTLTARRSEKEN